MHITSLDAGMVCPMVPSLNLLGDSTPIGEGVGHVDELTPGTPGTPAKRQIGSEWYRVWY